MRLMNEQRWHCEHPSWEIQVPAWSEVDDGFNPRCSLVVTELGRPPNDGFEIAESLKIVIPEVPLFLATEQPSVQVENEALSNGIDTVFEKGHEFPSLLMDTRAVRG
jgi:DNA-binding response OmpR family regulator